jgi:hypothetical protein
MAFGGVNFCYYFDRELSTIRTSDDIVVADKLCTVNETAVVCVRANIFEFWTLC